MEGRARLHRSKSAKQRAAEKVTFVLWEPGGLRGFIQGPYGMKVRNWMTTL